MVGGPTEAMGCLPRSWSCIVLVVAGCAVDVDSSDPGALTSSAPLVAAHSAKCIDVRSKSTATGAVIEQWTCNGGSNQRFALVPADPGYVFIKNANSGLCLNVQGRSVSPGALIVQWTCGVAAKNDQWRVCLLYTSDAADERSSVDLGGRRI